MGICDGFENYEDFIDQLKSKLGDKVRIEEKCRGRISFDLAQAFGSEAQARRDGELVEPYATRQHRARSFDKLRMVSSSTLSSLPKGKVEP